MAPFEEDDVPTLRELARIIRDFRDESRLWMNQMVRKDVHAVEHEALNIRVARLEGERDAAVKEAAQRRNQFFLAMFGAGLSLVTSLALAWTK